MVKTDFRVMMQLAAALGKAKKSGSQVEIDKAQKEHDDYHAICLQADNMSLGVRVGDL